jgi:ribonuclease HI
MTSFYVYADGGSRGNPGPAAYGTVVVRADTGEVVAERAGHLGIATNNVAEYNGLIAGLRYIADNHPSAHIEVRLDSKLVVEQMSGRWKIKHPDMRELALAAMRIHDVSKISYVWIPREQNSHADALANEVLDAYERGLPAIVHRDF